MLYAAAFIAFIKGNFLSLEDFVHSPMRTPAVESYSYVAYFLFV